MHVVVGFGRSPVTSMLSSLIQARWLTGASCAATCVAWLVARSHRLAWKETEREGEREASAAVGGLRAEAAGRDG